MPVGILKVKVKYKLLSLYIVSEEGLPIIGRDWLVKLEILL